MTIAVNCKHIRLIRSMISGLTLNFQLIIDFQIHFFVVRPIDPQNIRCLTFLTLSTLEFFIFPISNFSFCYSGCHSIVIFHLAKALICCFPWSPTGEIIRFSEYSRWASSQAGYSTWIVKKLTPIVILRFSDPQFFHHARIIWSPVEFFQSRGLKRHTE